MGLQPKPRCISSNYYNGWFRHESETQLRLVRVKLKNELLMNTEHAFFLLLFKKKDAILGFFCNNFIGRICLKMEFILKDSGNGEEQSE